MKGTLVRCLFGEDGPHYDDAVRFLVFKEFGGIVINQKSTIKVGDALTMEYVYKETVVDGDIDDSIFEMPKE